MVKKRRHFRLWALRTDARRGYLFHGNHTDAERRRHLGGQRRKYYIGNGNEAEMVSTLGKIKDGTDDYTFFVTNFRHKAYELKKNVVSHQQYVSSFELHDYPITEDDILSRGSQAWDSSLNTVNIGKFNIGPGSIGITEHCFYEAVTHAANRILYGKPVTDMSHVQKNFMDAWLRIVGMKLYQRRATDYFRNANANDRRYLLYNPTSKMKVTLQAEEVVNLLWEVIAAKGFEKDTYFSPGHCRCSGAFKAGGDGSCQRPAHSQVHEELFLPSNRIRAGQSGFIPQRRPVRV